MHRSYAQLQVMKYFQEDAGEKHRFSVCQTEDEVYVGNVIEKNLAEGFFWKVHATRHARSQIESIKQGVAYETENSH